MNKVLLSSVFALSAAFASAQTGNVGINTSTPQTVLDVNGNARVQQLPAAAGNITYGGASATYTPVNTVVADANGVLGIVAGTPATSQVSSFWSLIGNTGTTAGTNFLGTTDAQPLMFKVNNTAAGYLSTATNAGSGINNVALGYNAAPWMLNSPTYSRNVAIGTYAMYTTPTAAVVQNVAIGQAALYSFVSGGTNTAVGPSAMSLATAGGSNVAVGLKALNQLSASNNFGNIGIGYLAGAQMTGGLYNILIGDQTVNTGLNTTGNSNIYIGQNAGQGSTSGNYNIAIGTGFNSNTISNADNQLNIGNTIFGSGVNTSTGTTGKIGISIGSTAPNSTLQVGGSVSAQIRTLASGTIADNDFTVLAQGNIFLPTADNTNTGRLYHIVNDTANNLTVSGNFRINGASSTSYNLNNSVGGRVLTVQSTGSAWVVLSNY